ncbi:substrate-binding periplasmic protein [Bdellovibrio sp. HCB290]|uniref:substrate-binding periplasmic protein n=1 Tax=Bdellovibrio sp. HCB290 TaxID=3394356 RepID=UPI0039B57211
MVTIVVSTANAILAKCDRTFRVGVLGDEPLFFSDKSRTKQGSIVDILDELRKRTGCSFQVVEMSRPTLLDRVRNSTVDMTVLSIKTPVMDSAAGGFIEMFRSYRAIVMTPELGLKNYDLKKALHDKKVVFSGIIGSPGHLNVDEFKLLKEESRLQQFPDYASVFQALKRKQVQVFVGSVAISDYFLRKYDLTSFTFIIDREKINGVGSYYSKSRLTTAEVQMLKMNYEQMLKDGFFATVYSKYTSPAAVKNAILPMN